MKTAVIIGAGAAGLASASYLARNGFRVTVFEKNSFPGGRCASFTKDGHRFDLGATLMMMPQVYERTFADFGKNMLDELEPTRLDPVYRLKFPGDDELFYTSDLARMQQQLEAIEPGSYRRFLEYMDRSFHAYQVSMKHIIDRNYNHMFDFLNPVNLLRLIRLDAFGIHYKAASRYFTNEYLRIAFTFQNIYVGQNPFKASAIFSMLPFLELTDGVYFPDGGMNRVSERLEKIALESRVEINYRSPIAAIIVDGEKTEEVFKDTIRDTRYSNLENDKSKPETWNLEPGTVNREPGTANSVRGVLLEDGTFHKADVVIANADLPYVYNQLLPHGRELKRINRLGVTCSALVFHWGMDKVLPGLEQHNVFVSGDYKKNIHTVFDENGYAEEPSFYVHSPGRADSSVAPGNGDSISVIVPVGHMTEDNKLDWEAVKNETRKAVMNRLAVEGFADFEQHIKFEKVYNPPIWQNMFNLSHGAIFGSLNHNLLQMGYFRPHNQHPRYKNLFFAGGSTHPGNGVPLALISARLATEKVIKGVT